MDQLQELFLSWDKLEPYLGSLVRGFWLTVQVTFASYGLALAGAVVLALMRQTRTARRSRPRRALAGATRGIAVIYIDLFRGLPALLVLIVYYVSLPLTGIPILKDLGPISVGILGLTMVYAAYLAEILRAGIESIDRGQIEASRSLGLSAGQTTRRIVLPQAVRRVLPPLMNEFIILTKDTALLSVIAVTELLGAARDANAVTLNSTPLVAAGIGYLLFTIPMTRALDYYIDRERRQHGGGPVVIP